MTNATDCSDPLAAIKSRLQGYTAVRYGSGVGPHHLLARAACRRGRSGSARADHLSGGVSGLRDEPSLDVLAGWLAVRIDGPVQRAVGELKVDLVRSSETITLRRPQTGVTATLTRTSRPEARIPLAAGKPRNVWPRTAQAGRRRHLLRSAAGHRQGQVHMSPIVEKYTDTDALVAAAGDRLVDAITAAIDERGRAHIVLTGGGHRGRTAQEGRRTRREDRLVEGASVLGRRSVSCLQTIRTQLQAGQGGAARPHRHPGKPMCIRCRQATANSATTWTPRRWTTKTCWPPTPKTAGPPLTSTSPAGHGRRRPYQFALPRNARSARDKQAVVGVSDSPKPPPRRITLTLIAVQRSREVWLVVSGERARPTRVAAAIGGADPVDVPSAGAIGPEATVWLLDEDAASKL